MADVEKDRGWGVGRNAQKGTHIMTTWADECFDMLDM
jgi:hypothetical protein